MKDGQEAKLAYIITGGGGDREERRETRRHVLHLLHMFKAPQDMVIELLAKF